MPPTLENCSAVALEKMRKREGERKIKQDGRVGRHRCRSGKP